MPLMQFYACPDCGVRRAVPHGANVPLCGACRGPMSWQQTRDVKPEQHGWDTGMRSAAIDFNQTKGRVAPIGDGIPINSLHDIRRIERESEKRAADGAGEQYIFRKYANLASNLHTHTMGEAPAQAPSREWLRTHPLDRATGQHLDETPMGPGAQEDLASALPIDPGGGGTVIGE